MTKALDIIVCLIIAASAVLCQQIIAHSLANQERKIDYAELNHIQYGLLSIDAWKGQIADILGRDRQAVLVQSE